MKSCIIVFPLYRAPTAMELQFLENGIHVTKGFKQVIVAPVGLIVDSSFGLLEKLEVKRFSPHYFDGIKGYNQLMLSNDFYSAFKLFDYLLIHQPDVFLFKNEVDFWCQKNYDYIGAPWFRPDKLVDTPWARIWQRAKLLFKSNKLYASRHNKVGNGGFTLRKIDAALRVLKLVPPNVLREYTHNDGDAYNEDVFWSLLAPQLTEFRIPDWLEAMHFAIEFNPSIAYKYLDHQLPFGCHAPLKHDPSFWAKFIPTLTR